MYFGEELEEKQRNQPRLLHLIFLDINFNLIIFEYDKVGILYKEVVKHVC